MKSNNKNWMAIASFILSLLAIYFSYQSNLFSQKSWKYDQEDQLNILLTLPMDSSISRYRIENGLLRVDWVCIISNTGNRAVSIIGYKLDKFSGKNKANYTKLNGGIFTESDNVREQVSLPLLIQPGESEKVFLDVGIMLEKESFSLLRREYPDQDTFSFTDIHRVFSEKGIDFFGNPISPVISSDDTFDNYIEATFYTGKGFVYKAKLTYKPENAICVKKNADLSFDMLLPHN